MKALRKLTKLSSIDEVSRFILDIVEAWNILSRDKFLSRQTISTTLASGANTIPHVLGYEPQNYIITSQNASANFYKTSASTATINIVASAAVTVTIEVW